MQVRRRTNPLLGLVMLALALVVTAQAFGWLPATYTDILTRALPALLVLAGLTLLLRGRVPLAGVIAIVLSAALAAGVTALAYTNRAEIYSTDREQPIEQMIDPEVGLLRVRVEVLSTDVELLPTIDAAVVRGAFIGSSESDIVVNYERLSDGSATLTILETRPNPFPLLERLGRGRLRLELPATLPLDVAFSGQRGDLALNLSSTQLERLNVDLQQGDALVRLPDYDPILSGETDSLGTLAARGGSLTVFVPTAVAARLTIDSSAEPDYDPTIYNLLVGGVLEARGIDSADKIVNYAVIVPEGRVRLEIAEN